MSQAPAVSIIMPTYNRPVFLRDTLQCVLAQTCTDWELIVADDGSGPETRELLGSLSHERIRVLWLTHTGNVSTVRNLAQREARGEYVAFLDSDDLWMPQKLERQLASLRRQPQRQWGYTRFVLVDAAGRPLPSRHLPRPQPGWIYPALVGEQVTVAMSTVMARRSLLEQAGGHDCAFPIIGDLELWTRLATLSEADALDEPLTHARRHSLHWSTDILVLEDLGRALLSMQRSPQGRAQAAVIRARRARVAAYLAQDHAREGHRCQALLTLVGSMGWHALRQRAWWRGACVTAVLALAPRALTNALRAWRRRPIARQIPTP